MYFSVSSAYTRNLPDDYHTPSDTVGLAAPAAAADNQVVEPGNYHRRSYSGADGATPHMDHCCIHPVDMADKAEGPRAVVRSCEAYHHESEACRSRLCEKCVAEGRSPAVYAGRRGSVAGQWQRS